jgi:hypothetical protein
MRFVADRRGNPRNLPGQADIHFVQTTCINSSRRSTLSKRLFITPLRWTYNATLVPTLRTTASIAAISLTVTDIVLQLQPFYVNRLAHLVYLVDSMV